MLPGPLHDALYPRPPKVTCADCGRVVAGRRLSKMRGGALHPRPHKTHPNDGDPCNGHKRPGEADR